MGAAKRRRLPRPAPSPQLSSSDLTVEADRFTAERIREQLSTEPVDEPAAEELLRQAYAAADLPAPGHIHWLDGPLELVAALAGEDTWLYVDDYYRDLVPHCVWNDAQLDRDEIAFFERVERGGVEYHIRQFWRTLEAQVGASGRLGGIRLDGGMWGQVTGPVASAVREQVAERIWRSVGEASHWSVPPWIRDSMWGLIEYSLWHSIRAYDEAPRLVELRFFDEYVVSNKAHALACFNELVSGYWLGQALALLVRRPRLLSRDEQGRLHSTTGPCIEYHDGWGFYAWHGVAVPENVIRAPEALTRDDFVNESNVEARRIIMERMGERFVREIGARFVDSGPRGVLYEIDLPDDPDKVARYVQVLDPSTSRDYYLRVPPTIQTAEEAVAWTFGLSAWEYDPAQES